jgi:hypothetical protein
LCLLDHAFEGTKGKAIGCEAKACRLGITLTREVARRIAANIAKLSALLRS